MNVMARTGFLIVPIVLTFVCITVYRPVHGQERPATVVEVKSNVSKAWTPPRTADGQPDLQGYWTNDTFTPLERPSELAGKELFTDEEAAAYLKKRNTRQDIFASDALHVVERFTRVAADRIRYQFTVEDPATWTKPWSGEIPVRRFEGPLFEYACHEGNYGLAHLLNNARAQEKAASDPAKKDPSH